MNTESSDWPEEIEKLRQEKGELEQAMIYYKRLSDEVAGYNIRADSSISLQKRSLQQKQDGFSILAAMHDVFESRIEPDAFFKEILELINTLLKMDHSLILWESKENPALLQPKWMLGFSPDEQSNLFRLQLDQRAFPQDMSATILVNKKSKYEDNIQFLKEKLGLRYFLGIPIRAESRVIGWLFSGREKEAWPFYPTIDKGDLDTFQAIGSFIEAGIANYRLYRSLEKANESLEKYNHELEQRVKARTLDLENRNDELALEKKRTEELLLNILPAETAEELKTFGRAKAKRFDAVTVMFTDFVNFTRFSEVLTPEELVAEIDCCFRAFDEIVTRYGVEKIKTIGDAYMCAGGLPAPGVTAADMIRVAFEIRDFMLQYAVDRQKNELPFLQIRIGLHQGPIVAGVVGVKKFSYDVWGDTVNIAARMEGSSKPGKINVSGTIYQECTNDFHFEYRGRIAAKNKGEIDMYFVENK